MNSGLSFSCAVWVVFGRERANPQVEIREKRHPWWESEILGKGIDEQGWQRTTGKPVWRERPRFAEIMS